jgi:uncharacterized linocin/CFP29 family protein
MIFDQQERIAMREKFKNLLDIQQRAICHFVAAALDASYFLITSSVISTTGLK